MLRGRDIARYQPNWAGLWLIDTHNGYAEIPPVDVDAYPAIKKHLEKFAWHLERRHDQGVTPYNLRNCAYHRIFERPKLLWKDMTNRGTFTYSDSEVYANDKVYVMTGEHLRFLCAVLNCSAVSWLVAKTGLTTGMGLVQWKKFVVEQIPIVRPDEPILHSIETKVKQLTDLMAAGAEGEAAEIHSEIDRQVCELYGLSGREIKALDGMRSAL